MIDPFKTKVVNRLKKAKGQIDGLISMIENDKYCMDVLTQSLALQGSLKGIGPLILESHLNSCAKEKLTSKDSVERQKFIKEIVKSCELSGR